MTTEEFMGCRCCLCGQLYRVDLLIPDDLWQQIMRPDEELVCGPCIMRRVEHQGKFDSFEVVNVV